MIRDTIVEEVRQIRHETEKACAHDWQRLIAHYRSVKPANGHLIRREPKRLTPKSTKDPAKP